MFVESVHFFDTSCTLLCCCFILFCRRYCLNFKGRVTVASVKNFQLCYEDNVEPVLLQVCVSCDNARHGRNRLPAVRQDRRRRVHHGLHIPIQRSAGQPACAACDCASDKIVTDDDDFIGRSFNFEKRLRTPQPSPPPRSHLANPHCRHSELFCHPLTASWLANETRKTLLTRLFRCLLQLPA
jgi:hypothetical protein